MLSFKRGKSIAVFTEGKLKGKELKLYGENQFGDLGKPDIIIDKTEYSQLLDKDFYKEHNITPAKKRLFNKVLDGEIKLDEVIARCWNGGPKGWKKKPTNYYWTKVRKEKYIYSVEY